MRVIVQRSGYSKVVVNNNLVGEINSGLVLLVGFTEGDTIDDLNYMAKKVLNLRIFNDADGIMNKSILEVGGEILSISQFTLYADTKKGNRPSYIKALNGSEAIYLYEKFNEILNKEIPTYPGVFGADMKLSITNLGPVTITLDSKNK